MHRPFGPSTEAMVKDNQVRPLVKLVLRQGKPVITAAVMAGIKAESEPGVIRFCVLLWYDKLELGVNVPVCNGSVHPASQVERSKINLLPPDGLVSFSEHAE